MLPAKVQAYCGITAGMGLAEGEEASPLAAGIAATTLLTWPETPQRGSGFPKHFSKMKSMGVAERSSFFQLGPCLGLV